jgi:predicted Zn-dependent protease
MTQPTFFSRDEMRRITGRVLGMSRAEQARVNIASGLQGNTRFAVNQVSTAGDVGNAQIVVTSAFGRRVASATTNGFDDDALRRVVDTSERLAQLVPEDPEYLGELAEQRYPVIGTFFDSTAALDAETRAAAVEEVTRRARARNLVATGFLPYSVGSQAVATSRGLFAYSVVTQANFTTTVRTPDGTGSGWAGTGTHDWAQVDTAALGARAIDKAERSRGARAIEPGSYTVILEPTAVANMVSLMMGSLAARTADEGRSFFSRPGGGNRIGERFVDERITIHSDPSDPALFTTPFATDGLPNQRTMWVENGTLENLAYDRFWAQQQERAPTGFPSGFAMAGGDATVDEMIAATGHGLLVTRFWYIRAVDPRTILFTGLTRDGTFLIENGRITAAVRNLRWNESPIAILNSIEMMGRPERVSATESGDIGPAVVVPALRVRNFRFTSVSDAV